MYYPIGWHKVLKVDTLCDKIICPVMLIEPNHERELFCILTERSVHIWYPRPAVEIVSHKRTDDSVANMGRNLSVVWRPDSSVLVVATDKDHLLFFQIKRIHTTTTIYRINDLNKVKRYDDVYSTEIIPEFQIPALKICTYGKINMATIGYSALMPAEEELIVASKDGQMYGLNWDGSVDSKFPWSLSRDIQLREDFIVDLKFSSVVAGFGMVFQSGRVGFMASKVSSLFKSVPSGVKKPIETSIHYLPNITNGVCAEVNHRHRLVAFGLADSRILVCELAESGTKLAISVAIEPKNYEQLRHCGELGPVQCLHYSPDNCALVTTWKKGGLAFWSIFGTLLFSSHSWFVDSMKPIALRFPSVNWGREGLTLWMCKDLDYESDNDPTVTMTQNDVCVLSLARCNLTSNSNAAFASDAIVLTTEEKVFIGASKPHNLNFDHWNMIEIPISYINEQFPIRYTSVDRDCKNLAIAGNRGFALYHIESKNWKFFTEKSYVDSFSVCGDVIWWHDYLVLCCFNTVAGIFELRVYKVSNNLDKHNMVTHMVPTEILKMSLFENRLLVLYVDGNFAMFMLNLRERPRIVKAIPPQGASAQVVTVTQTAESSRATTSIQQKPRSGGFLASLTRLATGTPTPPKFDALQILHLSNLKVTSFHTNAFSVSSIALTRLHFRNGRQDDSVLLNACGKLFLLEREETSLQSTSSASSVPDAGEKQHDTVVRPNPIKKASTSAYFDAAGFTSSSISSSTSAHVAFKTVSVIATNVEQFWISPDISTANKMAFLRKSLWLYTGGFNKNLWIWFPLLNDEKDPPTGLYVPDRIMLPIKCDIYPLAVRCSSPETPDVEDAIVLGTDMDTRHDDCELFKTFPYSTINRQCRVYLHRILRELLLHQRLGYYAKKMADRCQTLPYFAHSLELLLHEVLEEEATSSVPVPDPMLPQVVRFIREYDVYLDVVVNCTRKTDFTMWTTLFGDNAVGNPRKLFRECMSKHKLDTAASCLIILQTLDTNTASTARLLNELIEAAKGDEKFNHLVEDLNKFLDRAEIQPQSQHGPSSSQQQQQ